MSFLWTRAGDVIHSRCTLCSLVLASRLERDIHDGQRAHDPAACQQRRLDAARAAAPEFDYVLAARKHAEYVARRDAESRCGTTVSSTVAGVADGKMDLAKTNRPTRERRTVLSTPSALNGKEAVDS
jgi:hypothetical protein